MSPSLNTPLVVPFHLDDRPASLTTRESLATYLGSPPEAPALPTAEELEGLNAAERAVYDRKRILYLSGGITLSTPYVRQALTLLHQSMMENSGRIAGHSGLMLNGASTSGKTTTAIALMRWVFQAYTSRFPHWREDGRVPVIYIEVPASSTGKLLMRSFAQFLGVTVRDRESMGDIRARIVDTINKAGTQLVVVDELQNLAGRGTGNGESVDLLKNLHNDIAGTFVYAGIDLTTSSLMNGARGQQIKSRFSVLEMKRYNWSDINDRRIWKGIVAAFEAELPLHAHEKGTLAKDALYLYERTGGSIGSLAKLITGCATQTILNGDPDNERIDRAVLDSRQLDYTAESLHEKLLSRKSAKGTVPEGAAA